jgi:PKD domain
VVGSRAATSASPAPAGSAISHGRSSEPSLEEQRQDFGDGSRFVTTTGPTVTHEFGRRRNYEVRVEVTDSLGHRAIGSGAVELKGEDDDDD